MPAGRKTLALVLTAIFIGTASSTCGGLRATDVEGVWMANDLGCECSKLQFLFGTPENPYTPVESEWAVRSLAFPAGCPQTQHCLLGWDDTIANAGLGYRYHFPVFEDQSSSKSPSDSKEILINSQLTFDERSQMYIHGIGLYTGPDAIGNYLAVPHFNTSGIVKASVFEVKNVVSVPTLSLLELALARVEQWTHLGFKEDITIWELNVVHYPCSMMVKSIDVQFPDFTAKAFSDSARVEGTVMAMCNRIMSNCVDNHQQFANVSECEAYMNGLPHHDPTCVAKFGQYTAQGESLMCKYLHQFMTSEQPELHCYHAGRPLTPDAHGKIKCAPTDCADVNSTDQTETVEPCLSDELTEIAEATVRALPFCLPALQGGSCSSTNCTLAINTFLGRLSSNGAVCRCAGTDLPSRLLLNLEIDALLLLRTCGSESQVIDLPSCLIRSPDPKNACAEDPVTYLGNRGCVRWDWDRFFASLMDDWSEKANFRRRITNSDAVATSECDVYSRMMADYLNDHFSLGMMDYYARFGKLYPHPSQGYIVFSYDEVLAEVQASQQRDFPSRSINLCNYGAWDKTVPLHSLTVIQTTDSVEHRLSRSFLWELFHSSIAPAADIPPPPFDDSVTGDEEDEELDRLLGKALNLALYGRSVARQNDSFLAESFADTVADNQETIAYTALSHSVHRALGYTAGLGAVTNAHLLRKSLRKLIPPEEMQEIMVKSGVDGHWTMDQAYETASVPSFMSGLGIATTRMVKFIRANPCELMPLWQKNPERFIVEYFRLYGGVPGIRTGNTGQRMNFFSITSANRDPAVFPNPLVFNPDRDLSRVLVFNALEGDFYAAGDEWFSPLYPPPVETTTLKRACPGRHFVIKVLASVVPVFSPNDVPCSPHGIRRFNGVDFRQEAIGVNVRGNQQSLDVYKTDDCGHSSIGFACDLLVTVHGFPLTPQSWAPLYSRLRESWRVTMWSVALPGWGEGTQLTRCTFSEAGEALADLLESASKSGKWNRIYLMGHDLGATVAWRASQVVGADVLSALISVGAGHPRSTFGSIIGEPLSSMSFAPMMSPLADSYFTTNDFDVYQKMLENQTWWGRDWKQEHLRFWSSTRSKNLNCYFKDNFSVRDGNVFPVEWDALESTHVNQHILLVSGELDWKAPKQMFEHTLYHLPGQIGRLVHYHQVQGADHLNILMDESHADEVSKAVLSFKLQVERLPFSSWNSGVPPVVVRGDPLQRQHEALVMWPCVFGAFAMVSFGFALEVYLGPYLVQHESLWKLSQLAVAPAAFGAVMADSFAWMIVFALAEFKFGYPEVVTAITAPFDAKIVKQYQLTRFGRLMLFLDGFGAVIHHVSAAMLFVSVAGGLLERQEIIASIPLGMQHMASGFLKYHNTALYIIALLGLEFWFQAETFFLVPTLSILPKVAMYMLITSHYIWTLVSAASAIGTVISSLRQKKVSPLTEVPSSVPATDHPLYALRAACGGSLFFYDETDENVAEEKDEGYHSIEPSVAKRGGHQYPESEAQSDLEQSGSEGSETAGLKVKEPPKRVKFHHGVEDGEHMEDTISSKPPVVRPSRLFLGA